MAKVRPASLTPRRFPKAIKTTKPIEIQTVAPVRVGKTDVIAAVPAATETATVSV